jgi:hypothetical protein
MVQAVGVEIGLHHFHQLVVRINLLEHPPADLLASSQCLEVLSFQTPEPPEISRRLASSSISRNLRGIPQNLQGLLFCRTSDLWPFEWC